MLSEAGAVLAESEKPLSYVATLITILGVAAGIAYVLTIARVATGDAIAIGILAGLLGLAAYYLAVAIRRGARAQKQLSSDGAGLSSRNERIKELEAEATTLRAVRDARVLELEQQLGTARDEAKKERERLETKIQDGVKQHLALVGQLDAIRRELELEKQNSERAKVAPAMDPYYRFEPHTFHQDRHFVGVVNKGLGPAENVSLVLNFRNDVEAWEASRKPYSAVLDRGGKFEVELDRTHVERKPQQLDITVEYDDLARAHHSKSVSYSV